MSSRNCGASYKLNNYSNKQDSIQPDLSASLAEVEPCQDAVWHSQKWHCTVWIGIDVKSWKCGFQESCDPISRFLDSRRPRRNVCQLPACHCPSCPTNYFRWMLCSQFFCCSPRIRFLSTMSTSICLYLAFLLGTCKNCRALHRSLTQENARRPAQQPQSPWQLSQRQLTNFVKFVACWWQTSFHTLSYFDFRA